MEVQGKLPREKERRRRSMMPGTTSVEVNGVSVLVKTGSTVIQACEAAGVEIPRFCYHERLLVAGNCRMCLVEIGGSPKPQAACAMPVSTGMKVYTESPRVKKAREMVLEYLLLNHPLDCPICDQGGECDRQDEAMAFGSDRSRLSQGGHGVEAKRGVEDKSWGPLIKAIMTRCIHCTRCIRFSSEVAGVSDRGTSGRGVATEVGTYFSKPRTSEVSGNLIDLCPVGALTSKEYAFKARPWELTHVWTVDSRDGLGASILVQSRGNQVLRVLPRENDEINQAWLGDKSRFSRDGMTVDRLFPHEATLRSQGKPQALPRETALNLLRRQRISAAEVERVVGSSLNTELRAQVQLRSERLRRLKPKTPMTLQVMGGNTVRPFGALGGMDRSERTTQIQALSSADLVRLVGLNPRVEAPLRNLRLRESYLRDAVKVFSLGPTGDLTYPVNSLGSDRTSLLQRADGLHPWLQERSRAKRPRILVGPTVLQRQDAQELRRSMQQMVRLVRSVGNEKQEFLHRIHTASGSASAQVMKRPSFDGWRSGATTRRFGVEEADLRQSGAGWPKSSFRATFGSYVDSRSTRSHLSFSRPRVGERMGTLMNTEGRVQKIQPVLDQETDLTGESHALMQRIHLIQGFLADRDGHDVENLSKDGREIPVWRSHSVVFSGRNLKMTGSSGLIGLELQKMPRIPHIHDYYLESHPISRRSQRMALASLELVRRSNFA